MKRKSIFLLGTILAGAALVGGTFAAWAVTDNASPFNVQITPGTLDVGENKSVTLEWGTKGLVNIENIEMGQEKGPYVVGLKATTNDGSAFTGNLSLCLATTATTTDKLIDYLDVKVYDGTEKKVESEDPLTYEDPLINITYDTAKDVPAAQGSTASKSYALDLEVASSTELKPERPVSFYITLKSGLSPVLYNAIKDQVVTLTVDWNMGSTTEVIDSQTLFFSKQEGWTGDKLYVYAYDYATGKANGDWPGQAMTNVKGNIWSCAVEDEFDRVIFNDNSGHQIPADGEPGLVIPEVTANTPYYHYDSELQKFVWSAAPDVSADSEYYFVSDLTGWDPAAAYKLTKLSEPVQKEGHSYSYALMEGSDLKEITAATTGGAKIVDTTNNIWYNETSFDGSAADVDLVGGGKYHIYFNPLPDNGGGQYLYLECTNITFDTYDLDLVGDLEENNNWTTGNPTIFVYAWNDTPSSEVPARSYRLSSYTTLKVPADANKFLLVRAATGTKTIVWDGSSFYNQSEDLTKGTSTHTLVVKSWADGQNGKSTFAWEK